MTYQEVAEHFGVELCPDSEGVLRCGITFAQHDEGYAWGNTIHWTPRRLNKLGLRRFLKLIARERVLRYNQMNAAMRIYAEATWAQRAAGELHLRFPRRYSVGDRAKVRWLISQGQDVTPAARRWAEREEIA